MDCTAARKRGVRVHNIRGSAASRAVDRRLGILLALFPGECFDLRTIAACTGLSYGGVWVIQQRALSKLRKKLKYLSERKLGKELEL